MRPILTSEAKRAPEMGGRANDVQYLYKKLSGNSGINLMG